MKLGKLIQIQNYARNCDEWMDKNMYEFSNNASCLEYLRDMIPASLPEQKRIATELAETVDGHIQAIQEALGMLSALKEFFERVVESQTAAEAEEEDDSD